MGIILFRRHSEDCDVWKMKRVKDKRLFLHCESHCPIWMVGQTDTIKVLRQSCKTRDLDEAKALRDKVIKGESMAEAQRQIIDANQGRTIQQCIDKYMSADDRKQLSDRTRGHYVLALGRLQKYCADKGVIYAQEMTVDLLGRVNTNEELRQSERRKETLGKRRRAFRNERRCGGSL